MKAFFIRPRSDDENDGDDVKTPPTKYQCMEATTTMGKRLHARQFHSQELEVASAQTSP